MNKILRIYNQLFKVYGPQGWWPLICERSNPTKNGEIKGYHPNNYEFPKTCNQIYEVCIGAILTQNTSWRQVEKTLLNLNKLNAISPKSIMAMDIERLKEAIKPAGYFNQKAIKLKRFTEFFLSLNGRTPTRDELLSIWGVGKETADSMLLYAFKMPTFIVDAYTRRIFTNLRMIDKDDAYDEIKALFENNLEHDLIIYQEYHALIVEHAKLHYSKNSDYAQKTKPILS